MSQRDIQFRLGDMFEGDPCLGGALAMFKLWLREKRWTRTELFKDSSPRKMCSTFRKSIPTASIFSLCLFHSFLGYFSSLMTWLHILIAIVIHLLSTHSHLPCKVHSLYHVTPFLSYKKSVICRIPHTNNLHIVKGCQISCTASLRADSLVLFFLTLPLFMAERVVSHLPGSI